MRAGAFRRWQTGAALRGYFAVLSFVVIGLITLALCLAISYQLRRDLLQREWGLTADFIRTEALQSLSPEDFADPTTPTAQERFARFYKQTVMMPEIVRVKVYDPTKRIIWSDEPRLIGQLFPDNRQLAKALRGRTSVSLYPESKNENLYEADHKDLVEVYVPIVFPGQVAVVGVIESYKQPREVFANVRRAQLAVVATAVGGGIVLYLSLFWLVRYAARRIETQHQALEQRSRELSGANEELRQVQAQLLTTERLAAIGEVVTAVAHGIRNPLANIRAASQVSLLYCQDGPAESMRTKTITSVISEVDRLEARLKELFQFVRPAARRNTPLDLNDTLRGAVGQLSRRIETARLSLSQDLASGLPQVAGDPTLIEQIFVNLLVNAIEATPEGGAITVTTGQHAHDGHVEVFAEISDTGPGVPATEVSRIFELFHTSKAQGIGVGLPLAKKFAEAHGGRLAVTSHPGAGATFRATFPANGQR